MVTEETYPSWKTALNEHRHWINLKCAAKYVFWHSVYVLLAILGAIFIAVVWVASKLSRAPLVGPAVGVVRSDTAKNAGVLAMGGLYIAAIVYMVGLMLYLLLTYTVQFLAGIGTITLAVAVVLAAAYFFLETAPGQFIVALSRKYGYRAKTGAETTPVVRRVIGQCPVSLHITPKWFESIFDR